MSKTIDAAGKATQAKRLAERLGAATYEPADQEAAAYLAEVG